MEARSLILIIALLTLSGCATSSSDFCDTYTVVPTLYCGTEVQQINVDINNAKYLECI